MATRLYSRIAMLGAAPETRGAIAAVVDAYRSHGLLKRWPVTYIATHGDGAPARKLALAAKATREFTALLVRERRMVVHVHVSAPRMPPAARSSCICMAPGSTRASAGSSSAPRSSPCRARQRAPG